MKVTVYFGNVRVIVPCGKGDILVRDLMDLAITRYKKATGKSPSSVVTIHNLKSSRDDGILYPDDQLNDVADDREQIIAVFEEGYSPLPPYTCGDVTSTSSVYTGSPDLFSVEVGSHGSNTEMEDNLPSGATPLQVRRGSEPALNCLFPVSTSNDPNKRWSTAVVINSTDPSQDHDNSMHENGVEDRISPVESLEINGDSKMSSLTTTFSRGSGRLSILGNSAETYRWVEAADRQLLKDFNENFKKSTSLDAGSDTSSMSDESREKTIILKNESGPLGIHVVPDYDSKGRDTGLVIQGIEAGGRIDRDGRFHVGDRIIEINGRSLQNVSFQTAQEIFKSALKAPQIRLELVRSQGQSKTAAVPKKPPPPVYPKPTLGEAVKKTEEEVAALVEGEERAGGVSTKVATVTPTKKVPASAMRRLASANTRRIGKMLTIELTKGSAGLGFSITTRDNPAGGNSPIYIKNVLPKGAAIEDGRLQPGDRLLEVNGTPMTGKSQTEAVSILRNIPLGKNVQLVVSRQEIEETENTETENEVIPSKVEEEAGIFPWKYREILTFQIPLTDSHSAGLGVSVKGKSTSTANGSVDLGIFIKSVIPGGAASKDGRLQTNDQLVNINGISLLGMSNSSAMETLRNAMTQTDGPIRNAIILTIARRILVPNENGNDPSNPTTLKLEPNLSTKGNGNLSDDSLDRSSLKQNGISRLTQLTDLDEIQKNTPGLPGCNPVIERLTGQASSEKSTGDIYGYSRHAVNGTDDKKSLYSGPISSAQGETVLIEGEYDPSLKKSVELLQINGSVAENLNVIPAGSQLSLDENNPGFARDGFGRQSMSEKRHAQLDARNTGTYQRNKKAREERQQHSFESEEKIEDNLRTSPVQAGVGSVLGRSEVVGPSLGLRKSSSLESLQTMLQELNKDDEALKRALQSGSSRSARGRGCNESFRAAVDRSYDAPATAVTMETLDEESESGSHILTRSTEDPFQDDLLSMYCRNSKSSKKKSLLKGLGSVFKFGKNRKQSQDLKGKDEDSAQDSDFSQHQSASSKEQDKLSDTSRESTSRRQLPQIPSADNVPNRQERMQSLREQYQRLHQRRQGQYPLEQKEEFYENELKEKEGNYAMPFEVIHGRSQSLDIHKEAPHGSSKVHPAGDPNRYSHYMNYKEIQQHINQRSHHGPSVKSQPKLDPKPLPSILPDIPHSGPFFDHPVHHPMKKHSTSQSSDVSSNSLPRGTHGTEHGLGHSQGKPYFMHETHDHGNYSRMNVHHFYPNNKLYSHIVPGSKV